MLKRVVCVVVVVVGFASAAYAQKIYWAETFYEGTQPPYTVHHKILRADPDGSNVEDVVGTGDFPAWAITVDSPRGRVYWTDLGGALYRANLDGSGRQFITADSVGTVGVAVDIIRARLYWSIGLKGWPNGIRRANLDGSNAQTIYENTNNTAPERLALDMLEHKLYWTEGGRVLRANLDGTQLETVLIVADPNQPGPFGIAVDPIRRMLYWTAIHRELAGRIQRSTLDGQQIEDIGTLAPNAWAEIGVDPYSGKVYWTDRYVIRRANLNGSEVEDIIARDFDYDGPIAVDVPAGIPTVSPSGVVALVIGLIAGGLVIMRRRQLYPSPYRRLVSSAGMVCGVLVASSAATAEWEDEPAIPIEITSTFIDSGIVSATGTGTEPEIIYSQVVFAGREWMRLHFKEDQPWEPVRTYLSGSVSAGNASFLRVTSLADGGHQTLNPTGVSDWEYSSAYFTGDRVLVELLAYPNSGNNRVVIDKIATPSTLQVYNCAVTTGFCGGTDDRVASTDLRTARFRYFRRNDCSAEGWCSAFLIDKGSNWFLTAGHCCNSQQFSFVCDFVPIMEFGVPLSDLGGLVYPGRPQDQYPVHRESLQWRDLGSALNNGDDWCFFGVHRNSNSELTPGQEQGTSFRLAGVVPPANGTTLRVTGYGVDADPSEYCGAQQTAVGPYVELEGTKVRFAVDAAPRNSGSPVEHVCGDVYAILTDGTCTATGVNLGTAITHTGLQDALTPNIIDGGTKEPLGVAADCNGNGIKDWCDVSCGSPGGACDVYGCGTSATDNCNNNLIPDECEPNTDCDLNGVRDSCEAGITVPDCNGNGVPDSCDLVSGFSADCDCDGIPNECEICAGTGVDVNNNWTPDACDSGMGSCCRPVPYEDCIVTTRCVCDQYGGHFRQQLNQCSRSCPVSAPSPDP